MPKRGLPSGVGLKHDSHYVEDSLASFLTSSLDRVLDCEYKSKNFII